jgi:16S rRNA (cytidine1402-2'-O)-methyltransferase
MLYIVATPIGNLADITYRAVKALSDVDLIAAEDTRTSKKLVSHYSINTPLISFHSHSNDKKIDELINKLLAGENIALISDAGTPGISDPAFKLVTRAVASGIAVVPIPGVSAVITALSVSGAPTDKFIYLGFLPQKKGRQTLLKNLKIETKTLVIYESVHRIQKTLSELENTLGDRYVCVGREMTKMFEEYFRGTLKEAIEHFKKGKPKGEFTLVIAPENYNLNNVKIDEA